MCRWSKFQSVAILIAQDLFALHSTPAAQPAKPAAASAADPFGNFGPASPAAASPAVGAASTAPKASTNLCALMCVEAPAVVKCNARSLQRAHRNLFALSAALNIDIVKGGASRGHLRGGADASGAAAARLWQRCTGTFCFQLSSATLRIRHHRQASAASHSPFRNV